jgi:nucleotide-binding universal stress UspA family protein
MSELKCACPLTRGERILVAVDGSDFSMAAVDQAISLGGICNSQIFVISVVALYPEQMEVAPNLVETMSEEVRQHLDKAKEKVDKAGISSETIVRIGGKPHEFIVQEAKDKNIDLILMGTHGRTGLKRVLLGSVAQNVIAHAPCPVMVVPTTAE